MASGNWYPAKIGEVHEVVTAGVSMLAFHACTRANRQGGRGASAAAAAAVAAAAAALRLRRLLLLLLLLRCCCAGTATSMIVTAAAAGTGGCARTTGLVVVVQRTACPAEAAQCRCFRCVARRRRRRVRVRLALRRWRFGVFGPPELDPLAETRGSCCWWCLCWCWLVLPLVGRWWRLSWWTSGGLRARDDPPTTPTTTPAPHCPLCYPPCVARATTHATVVPTGGFFVCRALCPTGNGSGGLEETATATAQGTIAVTSQNTPTASSSFGHRRTNSVAGKLCGCGWGCTRCEPTSVRRSVFGWRQFKFNGRKVLFGG
jgi:hypothetical protein